MRAFWRRSRVFHDFPMFSVTCVDLWALCFYVSRKSSPEGAFLGTHALDLKAARRTQNAPQTGSPEIANPTPPERP